MGSLDTVDYLLQAGARRERVCIEGIDVMDVAVSQEVRYLLRGFERRLCVIMCDEIGKKANTQVFNHLASLIEEFL